jgi:hypothetical protein
MLINQTDCHSSTNTGALPASSRGRQPAGLDDLNRPAA